MNTPGLKVGDNIPVQGSVPPVVQTPPLPRSARAIAPETVILPPKPIAKPADTVTGGNWRVGDTRDGLQGAAEAVLKAIASLDKVPSHYRDAMTSAVRAQLEANPEHNYVIVHASGHNYAGNKSAKTVILADIETSKELL